MKNLASHFIIYLSTILLLVVGTTNYWLYNNNTERLKATFNSTAHSHLDSITNMSGYYISHYEFELLEKLVVDIVSRRGILYAEIITTDDVTSTEAGNREGENSRQYSTQIIYNDEYLGTAVLVLDDSQLKQDLQQALINSILLVLLTVILISALVFFFFRCRVIDTINLAHAEKELARKEKGFFSIIMDSASSLVIVLEKNGLIVLANSTCKHYLPDNINNIEGRPLWDFFSISCSDIPLHDLLNTNDADINAKNIAYLKENSCISSCEFNNEKAIIEWSFNALHDNDSSTARLIATGTDQTLQHLKSEKLSYLALHDSLTGLPNRSLFMDRLEITQAQYKRNNEAFCLLYLDLDGFKPINDNLGHEAGDFILKAVAEILQSNLRAVDTAARLGGDEFGIILTNIKNRDNAAYVAQKCIDAVSQPFEYLTHQLQLGISIGVIYYPDHKSDLVQLINHADTAMYKAKKSGGNTFCFYD